MAVDFDFCYEAKVIEKETDNLGPCYEAMHWLVSQGYHAEKRLDR